MLLLTFRAADDLYAVDVVRIAEVVPRVDLRPIPHAPAFLPGIFDYRGSVVPVIDLGMLLGSRASGQRLSTRIILVDDSPAGPTRREEHADSDQGDLPAQSEPTPPQENRRGGRRRLLGLIAEQVSDVAVVHAEQFLSSTMQMPQAPYLGAIVQVEGRMVQTITVERLLDESLRTALFGSPAGPEPGDVGTGSK